MTGDWYTQEMYICPENHMEGYKHVLCIILEIRHTIGSFQDLHIAQKIMIILT